jgi:hypothetical protein
MSVEGFDRSEVSPQLVHSFMGLLRGRLLRVGSGTPSPLQSKEAPMPKKGDVHVVPADKGWRVEVEGSGRAESTHKTQAAAWKKAKQIARKSSSEALLHGRNGRVRERNTYGQDPRRTSG